jgi:hypothetical protein
MGERINKYGLSDYIPAEVRRLVRRECGYGCVICGLAFVTYEHFDPPFEEATEHKPEGIALLCWACHHKKSSRMWSPQKVAAARSNPITFKNGFAHDAFDLTAPFSLRLGTSTVENVSSIVKTQEGERWLSIEAPEVAGGPVRLSAAFFDKQGTHSLTIDGNEWRVFSHHWDTECVGPKITVRGAPGEIVLELIATPPHGLKVTRLTMTRLDLGILIEPSGWVTIRRGGGETRFEGCSVNGSDAVFII